MTNTMTAVKKICENIKTNQAIQCKLCQNLAQINCCDLSYVDYKFLQRSNDPWYCISCFTQKFLISFHEK